ncbi:MAG: hypothetical protein K0S38_988 [Candidatus Paceibacter sp.]|jgi:hypothetical protein|nr:hypothetical protein [Candidatus Paceibacter sp.]
MNQEQVRNYGHIGLYAAVVTSMILNAVMIAKFALKEPTTINIQLVDDREKNKRLTDDERRSQAVGDIKRTLNSMDGWDAEHTVLGLVRDYAPKWVVSLRERTPTTRPATRPATNPGDEAPANGYEFEELRRF